MNVNTTAIAMMLWKIANAAIAKKVLVSVKTAARAVVIMQKKTASAVTVKQGIAIVMSM